MMQPGNKFEVFYLPEVVRDDIPALPKTMREHIKAAIEERLQGTSEINYGKIMHGNLKGHRRLRVGDWRVVFRVDGANNRIIVIAIKHRKDAYGDH